MYKKKQNKKTASRLVTVLKQSICILYANLFLFLFDSEDNSQYP